MAPVILDHFPARRRQSSTIVLQHINVFRVHRETVTATDTTCTATTKIPNVLDAIKRQLGLVFCSFTVTTRVSDLMVEGSSCCSNGRIQ